MQSSSLKRAIFEHSSACALEAQYQSSFFHELECFPVEDGGRRFVVGFGFAFALGLSAFSILERQAALCLLKSYHVDRDCGSFFLSNLSRIWSSPFEIQTHD